MPVLPETSQQDTTLRDKLLLAVLGVSECNFATMNPATSYEGLCNQLRASVATAIRDGKHNQYYGNTEHDEFKDYESDQYWTDREYGGRGSYRGRGQRFRGRKGYSQRYSYGHAPYQRQDSDRLNSRQKKCFVCGKNDCWSTKHPKEKRDESYSKFRRAASYTAKTEPTPEHFEQFLLEWEGIENVADTE